MSSDKQIDANRRNAKKSTGPRTAMGTAASSRNARKHGFTTIHIHNPAFATQIEAIARAICSDTNNPRLWQEALTIGECTIVLRCVRAERIAVIERMLRGDPQSITDQDTPEVEAVECDPNWVRPLGGHEPMGLGRTDLDRLERYERRALSCRKRAIESYMAINNTLKSRAPGGLPAL